MQIVPVKIIPLDDLVLADDATAEETKALILVMRERLFASLRHFDELLVLAEKRGVRKAAVPNPEPYLAVRIPKGKTSGVGEYKWLRGWLTAFNGAFIALHGRVNVGE
jgi:hypothetical protein